MKVLAIDYGEKKVGAAISDELGMVSAKLPVIKVNKAEDKVDGIIFLIRELRPDVILFGLPSGRQGEATPQTKEIIEFINYFRMEVEKKIGNEDLIIPQIRTWDESYSTKRAEVGKKKKYKKNQSDSEAARLFLQEFLDSPDQNV